MVKISELKEGDVVQVTFDGELREGTVVDVDRNENQVCVNNGVQDFWYNPAEIIPIPVTGEGLENILGFAKEETADGVKYKKGAFRVLVHDPGKFTNLEVWYREDRRHFNHALYLHELQNHHMDMTKVPLERVVAH